MPSRSQIQNLTFQISNLKSHFKSQLSNFKSEISPPCPAAPFSRTQRFRARANVSSGHAVWPAMRTGEHTSAHAKTLHFRRISPPIQKVR
jgi:hypothetical protein